VSVAAERIAKTEALFRNVNEGIAEASSGLFDSQEAEFLCECGDAECAEKVEVSLEEYEKVRAHATHFVVRPGHVKGPLEKIVHRRHGYSVIEKVDRLVASIARRLNPRAETA
jgi:DNA-directed RNA polymerase specialized sigma subunit